MSGEVVEMMIDKAVREICDYYDELPDVVSYMQRKASTREYFDKLDARAAMRAALTAAGVGKLVEAAQAVVARWDTPLWKEAEPTGHVISRLRSALSSLTPAKETDHG